ncbi:response regulator [Pseudomonas sp. NPDC089554]|uniref:response regulator n=1 Tax=Pseudomonas sp. NPDC089554 TaxID=3390653 RepID=UPI003D0928CB
MCIVDDDASVRKSLSNLLRSAGYEAYPFADGEAFLASELACEADCALLDLKMPGRNGVEVQRELARLGYRLPVICMSAHWDPAAEGESLGLGAVACLGKPFNEEALLRFVLKAVASRGGS